MIDRVLARRSELLSELLRVARRQAEALAGDHLDEFLACMESRRGIFVELRGTEGPWPSNLVAFPATETAAETAEAHALLPALVEAVLAQDELNERALRQKVTELRAALRQVRLGFEAAHGYAGALAPAPSRRHLNLAV